MKHFMNNAIEYFNRHERKTPEYYNNGKDYDIIDVCKDYALSFNRGNIVKYITRAGNKEDELKDLHKALDYLQREIEHVKSTGKV